MRRCRGPGSGPSGVRGRRGGGSRGSILPKCTNTNLQTTEPPSLLHQYSLILRTVNRPLPRPGGAARAAPAPAAARRPPRGPRRRPGRGPAPTRRAPSGHRPSAQRARNPTPPGTERKICRAARGMHTTSYLYQRRGARANRNPINLPNAASRDRRQGAARGLLRAKPSRRQNEG